MKKIITLFVLFKTFAICSQEIKVKGILKEATYAYSVANEHRSKYESLWLGEGTEIDIIEIKKHRLGFYASILNINDTLFIPVKKFSNLSNLMNHFYKEQKTLTIERNNKNEKDVLSKCHYEKNEKDEFTGNLKKYTKMYSLSDKTVDSYRGKISIELKKLNKSKFLRFYLSEDLGCAISFKKNRSYVKIKLENNTIVSFYHFGDTDCGDFSIVANLTKSDIYKLKQSPIKTIRFSGSKFYHDEKDIRWSTFFIDKLDCIN